MGAVAYVTLAKSYGTGRIDRQAWVAVVFMQQARSGNWGQMSERRAVLFAPNCKTFPRNSTTNTLVGGHVDQWTMHFKLLPKRRGRRGAVPLYIYIIFIYRVKNQWSTWSTCPQTRASTGRDVDCLPVHTWSTHGPHT